jgi:hypothetical protein
MYGGITSGYHRLTAVLKDGFVHVSLRELPWEEDLPPNKLRLELSVHDTGKGISQNFLKV